MSAGGMLALGWLLIVPVHPMHTSVTQIVQDPDGRSLQLEMRLFADDLAGAIGAAPGDPDFDVSISSYVRGRFAIGDGRGSPIPLEWQGAEPSGDVIQVRLRAVVETGMRGFRVANSVLCDRFPDQVNVVRVSYDDHTTTLIFTPGDPAKPVP